MTGLVNPTTVNGTAALEEAARLTDGMSLLESAFTTATSPPSLPACTTVAFRPVADALSTYGKTRVAGLPKSTQVVRLASVSKQPRVNLTGVSSARWNPVCTNLMGTFSSPYFSWKAFAAASMSAPPRPLPAARLAVTTVPSGLTTNPLPLPSTNERWLGVVTVPPKPRSVTLTLVRTEVSTYTMAGSTTMGAPGCLCAAAGDTPTPNDRAVVAASRTTTWGTRPRRIAVSPLHPGGG